MREIKFRAWNKDISYWEPVPYIVTEGLNPTKIIGFLDEDDGQCLLKDGHAIVQYTGLKDKNGREIYEGDIMPVNGHDYVVVYHEEYARFCLQTKSGRMFIPSKNSEVIGNIYENPELLGDTHER